MSKILKSIEEEKIFDEKVILINYANDISFIKEVLPFFIGEEGVIKELKKIKELMKLNELEEIKRSIHTLKGLCYTVGAQRATCLAKEIEGKLKQGDYEFFKNNISILEKEIYKHNEEIITWFENLH